LLSALAVLEAAGLPAGRRADAQILLGSPRQLPEGSVHVSVYWQRVRNEKLEFRVPAGQAVAVCSGNPCSFPGQPFSSVPGNVDGDWSVLKAGYQPWDRVQYFVLLGGGHFTLDVASVAVTNRLTGARVGSMAGAGARVNLVAETPVTPAVSLALGADRTAVQFNRMRVGTSVAQPVSARLTLDHLQASLWASKRLGYLEPYAGVDWVRATAKLRDLEQGGRNGGRRDTTHPVAGVRLRVFPQEALMAEARFAGGVTWRVAWEARFR